MRRSHFAILAKYNRSANEALFGLLANLPAQELDKSRGSYFRSIQGILTHIISCDINWLRRFRVIFKDMAALSDPLLDPPGHAWKTHEFASFEELARSRTVIDSFFSEFAERADHSRFGQALDYADSHGKPRRYVFEEVLDHVFNHQTHHRGQISQILDELGVKHDFSNILDILDVPD